MCLFYRLYSIDEVEAICSILFSTGSPPDSLIWHFNPKGQFTVRNAYMVALERIHPLNDETSSSNSSTTAKFWDNIWKANIHPKIKVCVWRICKNLCLPILTWMKQFYIFSRTTHLLDTLGYLPPWASHCVVLTPNLLCFGLWKLQTKSGLAALTPFWLFVGPFGELETLCCGMVYATPPTLLWLVGFNGGNLSSNQMPLCHLLQRGLLKSTNGIPYRLVLWRLISMVLGVRNWNWVALDAYARMHLGTS